MKIAELKKSLKTIEESLEASRQLIAQGEPSPIPEAMIEEMEKEAESLKAQIKEAEKPQGQSGGKPKPSARHKVSVPKKKGAMPTDAKVKRYLDDIEPHRELNLPFHKGMSSTERSKIEQGLAHEVCDNFNCYDDSQIPESIMKIVKGWLNKRNSEAKKFMRVQGRRSMSEEDLAVIASACEKIIKNSEASQSIKKRSTVPKKGAPSKPKPINKRIADGIVADFKSAYLHRVKQGGGKSKVDIAKLNKEAKKLVNSFEGEYKKLSLFATGKAPSAGVIKGFRKMMQDVLYEEPKPE